MAGNQGDNKGRSKGRKGGQSSRGTGPGRGWHGDPEGHARAGRLSSGNTSSNRGRGNR